MDVNSFHRKLDEKMRETANGVEYWMGRDIQTILGYDTWQRFEQSIERAKAACESIGKNPDDWFSRAAKPIQSGKGGIQKRGDYYLSRFACYLIAMNGDSTKPQIGWAQAYFAVQTRRQEMYDQLTEEEKRIEKRQEVRDHNKILARVATQSGVSSSRMGIFQDRGYVGLYTMPSKAIKAKKGIPEKENLLDFANWEELAANDFRIAQTARKLMQDKVDNELVAGKVHEEVGRIVRQAIAQSGNPMPEDLPVEPHIKIIERKVRTQKKLSAKGEDI